MTNVQREAARRFALEQDLRLLIPIARRQARKAGRHGLTVENVKRAAVHLQLGSTDRAYLSHLFGQVMIRAGLEPIAGRYVRTQRIGRRGGNLCRVWRAA
jgi:hypothetical protein